MSRVLLLCPEPLGHRQPAGIGIRFLEMARVLADDGHSIRLMSPDGGGAPFDAERASPEALQRATSNADVVVVQGHIANDLFAHGLRIPTVVDLYDPYVVENLHYYRDHGAEVFRHDHSTLLRSLHRGDFFLCASAAQRAFFLGMLMAVGRANPVLYDDDPTLRSLIDIAPFGVRSDIAIQPDADSRRILFGGIYGWYDPILAMDAVSRLREHEPQATLTFTRHPNPDVTPQGRAAEALQYAKTQGFESFITFEPWIAYEERQAFFARHGLALLTFRPSLETDLAMRTRIFDYIAMGLPVITSSAPGTDEVIERYDAGVVVPGDDPRDYARAVLERLRDPQRETRAAAARTALLRDYSWTSTLEPLRRFCRAPRIETTRETFGVEISTPNVPLSFLDRLMRRIEGRQKS